MSKKEERTMVRMTKVERDTWNRARAAMAERSGLPVLPEATFIRVAANEYANRVLSEPEKPPRKSR